MKSSLWHGFLRNARVRQFIRALVGVGSIAGVMAVAIAWRVAHRPEAPALLPILGWQVLVWLPWVAYYYAVRFLAHRLGTYQDATLAGLLVHVVAALLIAMSHFVWFWQVSSAVSPFLGYADTRFGAYAFFFVFWFLIDLLLYWAIFARPEPHDDGREALVDSTSTETFAASGSKPRAITPLCTRTVALSCYGARLRGWRRNWIRRSSFGSTGPRSSTSTMSKA